MKKYIDLTRSVSVDVQGVTMETSKTLSEDGWNATMLHLYSHSGTHIDAPVHFGVTNKSIDQFSISDFIGEAWVIRIRNVVPRYLLTIDDLGDKIEKIKPGDSLLLHTSWASRIHTEDYRNGLPRISEELARWCVDRKIKMLGVEPPSVADVNNLDEVTKIHRILFEGDVIVIEGLMNLEAISSEKVMLIALPLKIKDGDGAPARVIAIENE